MVQRRLIFTEALGCAPVAYPMLESYFAHHNDPLTLFVYDDEDFVNPRPELLTVIRVSDSPEWWYPAKSALKAAYERGHHGTALLWSRILSSGVAEEYIHFDADNIFLGNVIEEIEVGLERADLVGYRRPYAKAPNILPLRKRIMMFFSTDTVHTFAMGVRPGNLLAKQRMRKLESEIRGTGLKGIFGPVLPILDFFDRTAKRISPFASRTFFLGEGIKPRRCGQPSEPQFKEKFLNFSAVGSGYCYWRTEPRDVPKFYVEHAKRSFSLYNQLFLGLPCEIDPLHARDLVERAGRIDRNLWIEKP